MIVKRGGSGYLRVHKKTLNRFERQFDDKAIVSNPALYHFFLGFLFLKESCSEWGLKQRIKYCVLIAQALEYVISNMSLNDQSFYV
jgi:hypothetical protein